MSQPRDIPVRDPLAGSEDGWTLDHAIWASLIGPHRPFAVASGQAARYPSDVSIFAAIAPDAGPEAWDDVAALFPPGSLVSFPGLELAPPLRWEGLGTVEGVQMVATTLEGAEDRDAVLLGSKDVPEMLDLVARTRPGPFFPRTIELGTYLGFRRRGALVAMAGERLHPAGWTEISAVCTDPAYQHQGLATRLVRAVAAGIYGRGDTPFLHAGAENTSAIRLYQDLGFTLRRQVSFEQLLVPGPP